MKLALFVFAFSLSGLAFSASTFVSSGSLEMGAKDLVAASYLQQLESHDARKSIRGTKEVWTSLDLQQPANSPYTDSLKADLRTTDLDGALRAAGFKLMDPEKHSLAFGHRPTVLLSVLYAPKGSEGNTTDFYVVTLSAFQDVTPLGGEKMSMTTWLKAGDPILASGDAAKDIEAIRASARACVTDFIDIAQDKGESQPQ